MIYDDKENTFISIKNMKLFEELKLTREGADPEFAAVSVLPLLHAYTPPFCPVHVTVWLGLTDFCVPDRYNKTYLRHRSATAALQNTQGTWFSLELLYAISEP